ncbi:endonuclease/exonuclease/phosphatase family protein [Phenylobacterium sp. J426]|uniref:endonuclease/exonuclease/phosphatase family protein n=1 Tax=Phenylobacterium sp. J426 TaxID=2898439 RepID=UPI0021518C8F|nr:endonuclease/exonuclease/phosphatase family protein [Phenylobacterium sp. J426]MCR5874068.1 endonuclease/exonuclease/phosphatase family protein [Phenylobacterium sp. J426]
MVLTMLAAVSAAAVAPSPTYEATAPASGGREISVLTYNVRGLPWPIARGRAHALRAIGAELAALRREGRQPDVILLQEGFRGEVAELVRASGYRHWAQGPRRGGLGKLTGGGLHVLSDLPIRSTVNAVYSACAGYDCLAAKGVMLVRLEADGEVVDVVNTHMNSRRASGARPEQARAAHNRQTEELQAFLARHLTPGRPALIGGDFNVRNAPERYYHRVEARPYQVVSEFCRRSAACDGASTEDEPWLRSQDLQAFVSPGPDAVRPLRIEAAFDGLAGARLSDHDGYLVRYALKAPAATAIALAAAPGPGAWLSPDDR